MAKWGKVITGRGTEGGVNCSPSPRARGEANYFFTQRIPLLDEPIKLFVLLRDTVGVSIFILGA